MFIATRKFEFCCTHRLFQLEENHKCRNLHGHNYEVWIHVFSEELNDNKFVIDFCELKEFQKYLNETFDHKVVISAEDKELLKACIKLKTDYFIFRDHTTAENMAQYFSELIYHRFVTKIKIEKIKVDVYETSNCYGSFVYTPSL